MRRIAVLLALALLVPAAAAQELSVTPPTVEEGVQEAGDQFYGQFRVYTATDREMRYSLSARPGDRNAFRNVKQDELARFSEQDCSGCIQFLQEGGALDEQDRALSSAGAETDRWETVGFVVEVPEDADPGYHLIEVVPRPEIAGQGSVNVVSTAAVPIVFRVPGEAERSGKIIGVRAGSHYDGGQTVEATFYNDGTVTVRAGFRFVINRTDGQRRVGAGGERVAPGESATFSTRVDDDLVNDTFEVRAVADYGTGDASASAALSVAPVAQPAGTAPEPPAGPSPLLVALAALLLAGTSVATWRVVRYA